MQINLDKKTKGFTLIEVIVALSVFTFIIFISTGSILSVFDANRKSQNTRAIMDDLNYTIEAMTRTIRFGTVYHCDTLVGNPATPLDCASGAQSISVLDSSGSQVIYRVNTTGGAQNGFLERWKTGDSAGVYTRLTSPDVKLSSKSAFRVNGSATYSSLSYNYQPQVIIVIDGYAGAQVSSRSYFTLETLVSQRVIDSQ